MSSTEENTVAKESLLAKVMSRKAGRLELPDGMDIEQTLIDSGHYKLGTGPHHITKTNATVAEAVLFKIQNVREIFMECGEDNGWNDPESFICVRLPFRSVVFSYDHEFKPYLSIHDPNAPPVERHVNVTMSEANRQRVEETIVECALSQGDATELLHIMDRKEPDSFIEAKLYVDGRAFPGTYFLMLDETGHVLTDSVHSQNYFWIRNGGDTAMLKTIMEKDNIPEDMIDLFSRHGMICLTALQFLNIKNVEVLDNPPTRQQLRHAERQGLKPPVTYKTLVIHPMGKRRSSPIQRNPDGTVRGVALHIVRGHFKSYAAGAGLGRAHVHGVYWWSPQVRGSAEHGRVEKDYAVDPEAER
jgi:hypothetical protein